LRFGGEVETLPDTSLQEKLWPHAGPERNRYEKTNRLGLIAAAGLPGWSPLCRTNTLAVQQAALPKDKWMRRGCSRKTAPPSWPERTRPHVSWLSWARRISPTPAGSHGCGNHRCHQTGPWHACFEKKLSAAEIESLASYVRTFKAVK